jgi:hypothetical protein
VSKNYDIQFIHKSASDKLRPLSWEEQHILERARDALRDADAVLIRLGGKAGRLGECIVGTALLEGMLQALIYLNKEGMPVSIVVDATAYDLFDEQLYQEKYWSHIEVYRASQETTDGIPTNLLQRKEGGNLLILDLNGANDGMPSLQVEEDTTEVVTRIVTLAHLFRVGVRSYAQRGPLRRYADFIEDIFCLPTGVIDGVRAQPALLLSTQDEDRYPLLARECALDPAALQIVCFFQSVVIAKCYCRWDEVMEMLCAYFARHFPNQRLDFLVVCGPDSLHPTGLKKNDLENDFADFHGTDDNARVLVYVPPSLRDLAILTRHAALVLANDTGPGHIAGALHIPTVTPYLPGTIYSKQVWSSTLWHRGITLEPNPFSYQQVEAAILWKYTDIIDSIPPESLVEVALKSLPPPFCAH